MDEQLIKQDTLSDSKDISARIKSELSLATKEILVAMAWFTDDELFAIIEDKIRNNVKVEIILSEHVDNEKLDFSQLQSLGASVLKVKNVGWGMMHQKFCVIDRNIAISGSNNWSKNAKNNHESVIVTNYPKTVTEFVDTFFNIKDRAQSMLDGNTIANTVISNTSMSFKPTLQQENDLVKKDVNFQEESFKDFKDVLDSIIATEVGSFDKELLKENAYKRAAENNGDHQVLNQAMDSLYSNFINEIEVIEDKKNRLKGKIDEQQKVSVTNVAIKTENAINSLKESQSLEQQNGESNINGLAKKISEYTLHIESNKATKIPFIESKLLTVRKVIQEQSIAFVKPPINWPLVSLLGFMTILLMLYIFVFYSSVAYILIFSKEDILHAINLGLDITESPEVFNAHAITKIGEKGFGGILFLVLFVAIPLTLGMFKVITAPIAPNVLSNATHPTVEPKMTSFFKTWGGILLICVVDFFIAFKVAANIHFVEFLMRTTDDKELSFFQVVFSNNFLLVFVLGSLGIFLFGLVFSRFFEEMNQRNTTVQQARIKQEVRNLESEIENYLEQLNSVKEENDQLTLLKSLAEKDKVEFENRMQQTPLRHADKIHLFNQQLLSYQERIVNLAHIYRSQIENDKLPISKAEMENRVNIFMEGWSKYLYEVYSIVKAEMKTKEAIHEIENWLTQLSANNHKHIDLSNTYATLNN